MKEKGNPFKQQGESWMVRNEESWFGLCSPFFQGSISWLCYLHCLHALTIKGGMICSIPDVFCPEDSFRCTTVLASLVPSSD